MGQQSIGSISYGQAPYDNEDMHRCYQFAVEWLISNSGIDLPDTMRLDVIYTENSGKL